MIKGWRGTSDGIAGNGGGKGKGSFYLFTLLPFYLSKAFYLSKTFLILSRASFIFSSLAQRLIRM